MKKLIALPLLALGLLLALASPAFAEEVTKAVPSTITLEPWVVAIIIGTITPLITGLITKLSASSGLKALVNLVLVAVGTVLNLIVTNGGVFVVRDALVLFACTFVANVASYAGVWAPVGAKNILPDKGIG